VAHCCRLPPAGVRVYSPQYRYRAEAAILEGFRTNLSDGERYDRHKLFLCVNTVDIAMLEALRYGKGLRADELTAVHFMIDAEHAQHLRKLWERYDLDTPLRVLDCPDRQLTRAAQELVVAERNKRPDTSVTLLLPRRPYGPLERLLHDRTADKIAKAVSRTPLPPSCPSKCAVPDPTHSRILALAASGSRSRASLR
jgi:hypothetical protein